MFQSCQIFIYTNKKHFGFSFWFQFIQRIERQTLFLAFFVNRMDKTKESSKMCSFLPVSYKKRKRLLIVQKASISNYRCHAIGCSCPKKLSGNIFWTQFHNPDHFALDALDFFFWCFCQFSEVMVKRDLRNTWEF